MPPHSPQKAGKLARQSAELAFAAPQVIAHRVSRMWMAGTAPSARDQHEFYTMGAEKIIHHAGHDAGRYEQRNDSGA